MFKLIHTFEHGQSVLCTDGKFHNEVMVGRIVFGRKIAVKTYKSQTGVNRALAIWNAAVGDYAVAVEA